MNRSALLKSAIVALACFAIAGASLATGPVTSPASVGVPTDVRLVSQSASSASLNFHLENLNQTEVWNQGERFDRVQIEGAPSGSPEGWPELPSLVRLVLIPPESGVELKVTNVQSHILNNVNPYPRQPLELEGTPELTTAGAAPGNGAPLIRDTKADAVSGFWPSEVARLGDPSIMRGYRIVPVIINPVRYNPGSHELEVIDNFDIELNYNTNLNQVNLVENPDVARPSRSVERIIRNLVVNPPAEGPRRDHPLNGGSLLYVLGTGNTWNPVRDELIPLIQWRQKMGWVVDTLRLDNVSDANGVKQAIQTYYRNARVKPEAITVCGDGEISFVFGYFNKAAGQAAYPYESDFDFGNLEGNANDFLPEASVGRLVFDDISQNHPLRNIINKTIQYESDPYLGQGNDAGWQKRGAVESTMHTSGVSTIDICRWTRGIMLDNGYNQVNELYFQGGNDAPNHQFVIDNINGGVSVFIHRGELWMNPTFTFGDVPQLNNGRKLPFALIITCNTGDFGEHISDGGNGYFSESFCWHAAGAIGAVGVAGATHTAYNNVYVSGAVEGLFNQGITDQGWVNVAGRLELYSHYAGLDDYVEHENPGCPAWLTEFYIMNLMGDPAVDIFTDVPHPLDVTYDRRIPVAATHIEATVVNHADNSAARDATVCLYKQGVCQLVAAPDENGRVAFDLDPEWTQTGRLFLTVTGHNLLTVRDTIDVAQADFIGAGPTQVDDSPGNGDGDANQGETLELAVSILNTGANRPDGAMDVHLAAALPQLDVNQGDAQFDNAPEVGGSVTANFEVVIGNGFKSGQNAVFNVTTSVGETQWQSSVSIPVVGPKYEFGSLQWQGDPLKRASNARLVVTINNVGQTNGPALHGTLITSSSVLTIVSPHADFDAIEQGQSGASQSAFQVGATPFFFGGHSVKAALALESDAGFLDTLYFDIATIPAVEGDPVGPDKYGYIGFDNTDTSWYAVPTYEWKEIDPAHPGPDTLSGTNTNLHDGGEEQDQSVVVNLPFNFQYYGQDFDRFTVSTNGWIAMGDHHLLALARNRHMPGAENAPGMIAPFWDDLTTPQGSGIFTFYDEEDHSFIVEWANVQKLVPHGNEHQTFEVILDDPQWHPSFTGDGNVTFQYKEIYDRVDGEGGVETPFATVGIASPSTADGLEYSYWNQLAPGAARLEAGRVIKFSTLLDSRTGSLHAVVYDAATFVPIEGALVSTKYGYAGLTDANGEITIQNMLVDSTYWVKASKEFYNDSTIYDQSIVEDETTEVEFYLLHPEFTMQPDSMSFMMMHDSTTQWNFNLQNTGNGPLWFDSHYVYVIGGRRDEGNRRLRAVNEKPTRDESDEQWDPLLTIDAYQQTGNLRMQGVTFVRDHWLLDAGHLGQDTTIHNYFYKFDRAGHFTGDSLLQPTAGGFGLRDMKFDGTYLYGAYSDGGTSWIMRLDPDNGEELAHWQTPRPLASVRNLAIDPGTGHFWASSSGNSLYELELVEGDSSYLSTVQSFRPADPRNNVYVAMYGLAWFRDDPDGFNLYLVSNNQLVASDSVPKIALYKINTSSHEVRFLTDLPFLDPTASGRGGMDITPKWNNLLWVISIVLDTPEPIGDQVAVLELAPNSSWVTYTPHSDTLIPPGESVPIEVDINSAELDTGMYQVNVHFDFNAAPGSSLIPISLHVVDTIIINQDINLDPGNKPYAFALYPNYPNPFNPTTMIRFSLDRYGPVKLSVFDIEGREVARLQDAPMKPGRYAYNYDAAALPAGLYIYRLEAGRKSAVQKMVLIK